MHAGLDERIAALEKEIARRLMTTPRIGPITATAIVAVAPAAETFAKGTRFHRVAGVGAEAGPDWRQAEAWCDLQNGRAHAETAAHHRQQCGGAPGEQARHAEGIMAKA